MNSTKSTLGKQRRSDFTRAEVYSFTSRNITIIILTTEEIICIVPPKNNY